MPLVTEIDSISKQPKTYWMPEVVAEKTEEWQAQQCAKRYLTLQETERLHPKWTFAHTNAYVDDEYLFQNEGWKLIIDKPPEFEDLKHRVRNPPSKWIIHEKIVEVTYSFVDFTDEQCEDYKIRKMAALRQLRESLISDTDYIFIRALEENRTVSDDVIAYRKELRDLPSKVFDIVSFDMDNDPLWPIKPTVLFK